MKKRNIVIDSAPVLNNPIKDRVKDNILALRSRANISQQKLAAIYNRTEPTIVQIHSRDISKYEHGLTTPPVDKYLKLIAVLKGLPKKKK